ncbi:hypothetical protein DB41_CW00050 [Neochlamydia sp. TUME1]|nr:hypothetical protein DB41_CW00050 [Neochlamydia sp. TUME1]
MFKIVVAKSFLFHFSPHPHLKSTYDHSTIENTALFFLQYLSEDFPLKRKIEYARCLT